MSIAESNQHLLDSDIHVYTENEIRWELYLKRLFSVARNHRNTRPTDDSI